MPHSIKREVTAVQAVISLRIDVRLHVPQIVGIDHALIAF